MAAMALVGLRYLEQDNAFRRELSARYDDHLAGAPGIAAVPMAKGCTPSRHLYQVRVANRDEVVLELQEHGIYPGVHYRDNTLYPMYASQAGACPVARTASEEVISLPLHLRLGPEHVERVASTLRDIVARRHQSG